MPYQSTGAVVRPMASPTDPFVAPEAQQEIRGPSALAQISAALEGFGRPLGQFAQNRSNEDFQARALRYKEQGLEEGIAKEKAIADAKTAREKSQLTFKKAVDAGHIDADQNPWFVKWWKQQDGSVAADKYNEALLEYAATGPLANSTSHAESTELLDSFRSEWMKANEIPGQDDDFIAGFSSKAAGYEMNLRRMQTQAVSQNMLNGAYLSFAQSIQSVVSEVNSLGLTPSQIAEGITVETNKAIAAGLKPADLNAAILEAIIVQAEEDLNTDLLDTVNEIKTGTGVLGGTAVAKAKIAQARQNIYRELQQFDTQQRAISERKRQEEIRNAKIALADLMADAYDNDRVLTPREARPLLSRLAKVDPDAAKTWENEILSNIDKPRFMENDFEKNRLFIATYSGLIDMAKYEELQVQFDSALSTRMIKSSTYSELSNHARLMAESDAERKARQDREKLTDDQKAKEDAIARRRAVYTEPASKTRIDQLEHLFTQDPIFAFNRNFEVAKNAAVNHYLRSMGDWFQKNIEFDHIQLENAVISAYETAANMFNNTLREGGGVRNIVIEAVGGKASNLPANTGMAVPKAEFPLYDNRSAWEYVLRSYLKGDQAMTQELQDYANRFGVSVEELIQQQTEAHRNMK